MRQTSIERLENRQLLAFALGVGGAGLDYGTASARLEDGGVIVAGLFSGTVDFSRAGGAAGTLTSVGPSDIFLARYDADQQLVWARRFGGEYGRFRIDQRTDRAVDVAIDPRRAGGEVFVNGVSPQPLDAGEYVNAIAVAPDGSIYMTGAFKGRADFDPGPGTRFLDSVDFGFYDIFVARVSAGGNLMWAESFGGQFTDIGNDIALDADGNPYVTGLFTRTADFHPGPSVLNLTAQGRNDVFVMKLSVNGKLIWVSAFGSDEIARDWMNSGNGIAVDAIGNAYVTGTFSGVADFNPAPGRQARLLVQAVDQTDGFVMQLSTRGRLVWVQRFGGIGYDGGTAIALAGDPMNPDVVVGGYFEQDINVTVGGTTTTLTAARLATERRVDRTDLLVSRYSNNGTLQWARQIGGGGSETLSRIATDEAQNVYFTGGFWGTADFDPGPGSFTLTSTLSPVRIRDVNERRRDRFESYDAYFASLDANGGFRFAQRFGGAQDDFGIGLSRSGVGATADAFVLTGRFAATANLDPAGSIPRTARGRGDVFLSVFDTEGELL